MARNFLLYIATQDPQKHAIMVASLDTETGTLSAPRLAIETRDPGHFALSSDGRHLYMGNAGTPGGVSAFAIKDREKGALEFLNFVESRGRGPSFVSIDASGRYVLDANYGGGYVEVLAIRPDGSLGERTALVQHEGSSVHARQNKAYAHWFHTDPSNQFALAADLGTDEIFVYRFDATSGRLAPHEPRAARVAPGSGPRHLAFHPNKEWVYAIQELSNQIVAFRWDAARGTLTPFQTVGTLADGFDGTNTAAEIRVRADGRFLYASNRGEDSLVVYEIDAKRGELAFRQRVPSGGKTPRYFAFSPDSRWLVATHQEGGNVVVFAVDAQTGELRRTGEPVPLTRPMGVLFAPD